MIIQKIINYLLNRTRFFVNDGKANIRIRPGYMSTISVNKGGYLEIGEGTGVQPFSVIRSAKRLVIGKNVLIAPNCFVSDYQHDFNVTGKERMRSIYQRDCIIGDGAWLGSGAVVISSVVGKNSVVGANSVLINKKLPDNSIFVGDSRIEYRIRKIRYDHGS